MSVEPRRGCGYRKVGGTYLAGGEAGRGCGRLPIPLTVCPCCGAGIKQQRGWQWVDPEKLIGVGVACGYRGPALARPVRDYDCITCPAANPKLLGERAGLIWIGQHFYATPDEFDAEAALLGVSRRIGAVPRGFKLGETWVLLAHPRAVNTHIPIKVDCHDLEGVAGGGAAEAYGPGIFRIWRPTRLERIITDKDAEDPKVMARLLERGFTPVIVPHDDSDHRGSVHDTPPAASRQMRLEQSP